MKEISEKLRLLREDAKLSQTKIGEMLGFTQASINRYETCLADPSPKTLLWYADHFNVSLDYIFGRTDNPSGKLYPYKQPSVKELFEKTENVEEFIEMCFDPKTKVSSKLKQAMFEILSEEGGSKK